MITSPLGAKGVEARGGSGGPSELVRTGFSCVSHAAFELEYRVRSGIPGLLFSRGRGDDERLLSLRIT